LALDSDKDFAVKQLHEVRMDHSLNFLPSRPKFAKIFIILSGLFTRAQQVIARKKTDVDWIKIKHALEWLRCNNHLYSKLKIGPDDVGKPIVIDKIETAESE
jgi:hypothetical protein